MVLWVLRHSEKIVSRLVIGIIGLFEDDPLRPAMVRTIRQRRREMIKCATYGEVGYLRRHLNEDTVVMTDLCIS